MSSHFAASFIFNTEKKETEGKNKSRRLMMRKIQQERPRKEE